MEGLPHEDKERTAKRVMELAKAGEYSKAAGAVWGMAAAATGLATKTKFEKVQEKGKGKRREPPPPPAYWSVDEELYAAVCKHITKGHRHFPRQSAGGNAQSKFEHWAPCSVLDQEEDATTKHERHDRWTASHHPPLGAALVGVCYND